MNIKEETTKMAINGYHKTQPIFVLLDREDYERFKFWKWQESKDGYARRNAMLHNEDGTTKWKTERFLG